MALRQAMQLNRDCIDFMQQGFDQSAIDSYAVGWTTLDFTVPNGLNDVAALPAEAVAVVVVAEPVVQAAPAALAASVARISEAVIPPSNVDAMPPVVAQDVAASAAAAALPLRRRSTSMPSLNVAPSVPPVPQPPTVPVTAPVALQSVAQFMSLWIDAHPAFVVRSVPTDDEMSALPWHVSNRHYARPLLDGVALNGTNYYTMYSCAFEFDPINRQVERTTLGWLRCASNIPMVLHYNAGLAHHRRALQTGAPLSFLLALTNYQAGHRFLSDQVANHQFDHELDLVVMALYNNMGHCFASLNDDDSAMICFDHLVATIAATNRQYRLNPVEYEFYTERLRLGVVQKSQPAAAA